MKFLSAVKRKTMSWRQGIMSGLLLLPVSCFASTDAPFMGWTTKVENWLTGSIPVAIGIIMVAVSGLTLAFGDFSRGGTRLLQVAFGVAIAIAATSIILTLFGSSGAVIG